MLRQSFLFGILLFILTGISTPSRAWEYRVKKDSSLFITAALELDNHDLLFAFLEHTYFGGDYKCYILRLSENGDFISETNFSDRYPGQQMYISNLQLYHSEIIMNFTVGTYSLGYDPGIGRYRQDLTLIEDSVYTDYHDLVLDNFFEYNGKITFAGSFGSTLPRKFAFTVADTDFIIDTVIHTPKNQWNINCSPQLSENLIYSYEYSILQTFDGMDFHVTKMKELYQGQRFISMPIAYDNHSMLFASETIVGHNFDWDYDMNLFRIDSSFNIIDSMPRREVDHDEIPARDVSMIRVNDTIYFGGSYNFSYNVWKHELIQTKHRPFILLKVDPNLDIIWEKKYRPDASCEMYRVLKTHDDGILMMGSCFDWMADSNRREVDLYILKVNQEGNPSGNEEHTKVDEQIRVFPNPASNTLYVQWMNHENPVEITISDINGRQIKDVKISHSRNEIDIRDLPPGMYFLRLKSDSNLYSTKFIKE